MIRLGETQELTIVKQVEFGVYLAEKGREEDKILLPQKQVPKEAALGQEITVFVYKDSGDRIIATTNVPLLQMGQVAELLVVEVSKVGAFLNWGLEKDLLLPYKQQKKRVKQGEKVLVSLYIDKSERLCATMNVYENLSADSPYQVNDKVVGRVYEISDNFGAFVAVDNRYSALIPKKELYGDIELGMDIEARVVQKKEDGRLTLSIRDKSYLLIEKDAEKLLRLLEEGGGKLPYNDKSSPEEIKQNTQMSKNEFKRAVGNLLKNGHIEITKDGIVKKG